MRVYDYTTLQHLPALKDGHHYTFNDIDVTMLILLAEKFLQFDWL